MTKSTPKPRANKNADRPALTDDSLRDLVKLVLDEDRAHRGISDEDHVLHHQWIEARITAEKERADLYRTVRHELARKGAIVLTSFLFFAIVFGAVASWQRLIHP